MPRFFIKRPVFAWVVAIFIVLMGLISIPKLPVAQYPSVAPPSLSIALTYPGASPQTLNDSVVSLIERELSGVDNLLYFESSSDASGTATITVNFKPGTDIKLAQVDVQNQIKVVEPRLPQAVKQNGISVEAVSSGSLMIVGLSSQNGAFDQADLSDYFARNVTDELRRIDGVGKVQLFGAEKALRVWLNPEKLISYKLTVSDINHAINEQNSLVAPGRVGESPTPKDQMLAYPLTVNGQLTDVDEFKHIVLKANPSGSSVLLGDVSRVEIGLQNYSFSSRENGNPSTAAAIQLTPGANAVRTSAAVQSRLHKLSQSLPTGMAFSVPFDTSPFVKLSIEKVLHTFLEAMVLVFLVMYLFLQNIRYTFIPAVVAPVAILGTFSVMMFLGYSINVLTMFGMVLAIGIIVDDAIVVVENVERIMVEEKLAPKEATEKAMREITGAVVGITLVLTAVFIPMGLASGSVGIIYKQFTLSMAVSILFSAFLALTLTPALCATLLKPLSPETHKKNRFFSIFNAFFDKLTSGYEAKVAKSLKKIGRMMFIYLLLCAGLIFAFKKLPSSFLPEEDQGYFMTMIQLPSDATAVRTEGVVKKYEDVVKNRPAIEKNLSILGFSFAGSGSNSGLSLTVLKNWGKRAGSSAQEEADYVQKAMASDPDSTVMSMLPPPISELGTSSGFSLRLEDRAGGRYGDLRQVLTQYLELASKSPVVRNVYMDGLPDGQSISLKINRKKAETLGITFSEINQTISGAVGSNYVNDFVNEGRVQQVIIQADAPFRMDLEKIMALYVRNKTGGMVALSELVHAEWVDSPLQLVRYQGYPAMRISGEAAPGYSTGEAMTEMENLTSKLPKGYVIEWTGQSLQEQQSSAQAPVLMAFSLLVVFLVLAALYESWSIPVSVMLVVPLGIIGAVVAVLIRDMTNDVFFKIGLITIIGLSAKNAILIIEFAKQLHQSGEPLVSATIKAAKMRLRPIIMTSLAFNLGVIPLMIASGASAATQHAIGTGVFGGMITGTLLAIFFVPVFFLFIMNVVNKLKSSRSNS